MSSLIKGPLDGAAAVRELTAGDCRECDNTGKLPDYRGGGVRSCACAPGIIRPAPLPTTADVENDGDRGPRLSRDPLASIDAAAQGQHARAMVDLVAAGLGLHVDEVRILVWIARRLPREKLRAACEAATATGWCDTHAEKNPAVRTEVDGARAATLAAVRAIEPLIGAARTARRGRDEVLRDEVARRGGGEP